VPQAAQEFLVLIAYRYLITRSTGFSTRFASSRRNLHDAMSAFRLEWKERGLWDAVEPHIIGYDYEYFPELRQALIFVLLDDEFTMLMCELEYSIKLWDDLPSFDLEVVTAKVNRCGQWHPAVEPSSLLGRPLRRHSGSPCKAASTSEIAW
jgi:hypothetical protein